MMATPFDPEELRAGQQNARWLVAENSMTELSPEDRRRRLGYVPGSDEPSLEAREQLAIASLEVHLSSAVDAAPAWDWRNLNGRDYMTPVKNQGNCGSCVAFAATATVEGIAQVAYTPSGVDLSEASLFYCVAEAEQGRRCSGPDGGWWVSAAMDAFRDTGVPGESCYPYTPGDQACGQCVNARPLTITGWRRLDDVVAMKAWISTTGPVATAFTIYADFFYYSGGVYHHRAGGAEGGHAVCVVGYNDGDGYWICKNSWGAGWGESGYFRIAYGECGIDAAMWAPDGIAPLTPSIAPGGPSVATQDEAGNPRVYFRATDGHLHEFAWIDDAWRDSDFTALTGAPAPAGAVSATRDEAGHPRVYFVAADGDLHEFAWINDAWRDSDFTALTGAPAPAGAVAATQDSDSNPRVYYIANDGDLHEFAWINDAWRDSDFTALTGAPAPTGALLATRDEAGNPRVYDAAADGHLHEFAWINDAWTTSDLVLSTYR